MPGFSQSRQAEVLGPPGLGCGIGPLPTVAQSAVMFDCLTMSALRVLRRIVTHRRVLLMYYLYMWILNSYRKNFLFIIFATSVSITVSLFTK